MTAPSLNVAAVQAAPIFLDRTATLEKAAVLVKEAAAQGASLIVFPEAFVPGYPDWVWTLPPGRGRLLAELYAEYIEQSVDTASDQLHPIQAAAAAAGAHVILGISERPHRSGSLFNSMIWITPHGQVGGVHRKLVPTGGERLVWAQGDGSTLNAWDTPFGTIGGLICWENYMPLARYALWTWGVQIYVAPTWDHGDPWLATLRHIAREGRAFVIGCGSVIHRDHIPDRFAFKSFYAPDKIWINPGDSAVVAPNGQFLAGPVRQKEQILIAQLNPADARGCKWDLDVAGHYARPDVFRLIIDRAPRPLIAESYNALESITEDS